MELFSVKKAIIKTQAQVAYSQLFAFPIYMNTDILWFVGSGIAILFAGLLNLVAIDRGGSKFSKSV